MQRTFADRLPTELVVSIQHVMQLRPDAQSDPLDALISFDPVDVLNQFFPNEGSLGNLDAVQVKLAQDERSLANEIEELQEELRLQQDPGKMQVIQEMISDLLGQMSRIREKATESEAIVRNITKDIQVLDLAKANIILSMTTLRRLQMLANALSQLEGYVKEKQYADITPNLATVKEISSFFKPFSSVPRIAQLTRRIQELQGEIRGIIETDFDSYYLQQPNSPGPTTIQAACTTADVLGGDVRSALVARYSALLLAEYRRIFRLTDEAGQLDNISRRFAWFRRVLSTHEGGLGRAFLEEWRVGWALLSDFIEVTRSDIIALLSKSGKDLTVSVLLDTLQQTKDFELSVAKKFGVSLQDILHEHSKGTNRTIEPISTAFEPHMGVYVRAQDKTIADMIVSHRGQKSRASLDTSSHASEHDDSSPAVVLPSSTELFYFYGQTLDACAMLSTKKPLFELLGVFKKWLRVYAGAPAHSSVWNGPQPRRSMDNRWDITEIRNACLVINTADYCHNTAQELEERICQRIAEEYKEKVSLQNERDLFISSASSSIGILLREIEAACENSFLTLSRTSWGNLQQVTGPSAYVEDMCRALGQVVEVIRPLVESNKYFRNLLDKASSLVLTRFTNSIVKSRPLKENGAEQLLIDLSALKSSLLKLPGEGLAASGYSRGITKTTQRLEALLKVIVTPQNPPEGFILNYILLIGDASFSNFQKILDLKGTARAEQNDLLDAFVTTTSTRPELEQTSFLTLLDMDPSLTAHAAVLASPTPVSGRTVQGAQGEGFFATVGSPPPGASPGGVETPPRDGAQGKREVFSDFRRLMNFAVRRETAG
ncbi:Vps53-like protein [Vararia minispora EC-137]|uniref:Vps53-like protein n=1 Tax=Vararia minispora EC-137 TaxID=1314806 RepID=A0ACB8QGV7_9AGAM|nr:Vps53-like protein [Vararia minispora EC-137]